MSRQSSHVNAPISVRPVQGWRPARHTLSRALAIVAVAGLAMSAAACTPRVQKLGNLPDPDALKEVVPGEITQEEVSEIIGSPSTIVPFDNKQETWLYISETTETVAFFEPEVTERKIIAIHFDKEGVVSKIREVGLDQARAIKPQERTTPTAGQELTIVEQLIGNIGRFSQEIGAADASAGDEDN